jgi:DNA (cytosine-5)-methyltransferase 1
MSFEGKRATFLDLFAGCGGLSEGFLMSGKFEGLAHVELETPMVDTLRRRLVSKWRHSEHEALERVIQFDIQRTKELLEGSWGGDALDKFANRNSKIVAEKGIKGIIGKSSVDLVIGGPPCQAYSIAGRAQDPFSMQNDYRNYLFESFIQVIDRLQPKMFLFENVPGILSACPGGRNVIDRIFESFGQAGYLIIPPESMKRAIFDSYDFGVPQKRKRVFIIGIQSSWAKRNRLDLETIYEFVQKDLNRAGRRGVVETVRQAIEDLPRWMPSKKIVRLGSRNISHTLIGDETNLDPSHVARFHNRDDQKIFKEWVVGDKNHLSNEEKIEYYNLRKGRKSNHAKYRSLEWDKPSPTVVAHLHKDGLMFIHPDPDQARSITVREAALLQSFPSDYEFLGSMGAQFKMVGNAVPPRMAKILANAIAEILQNPKVVRLGR